MKTALKLFAIAACAVALNGCVSNYVTKVAVGTPSAQDCAKFAALGDKAVKAGDKAEAAEKTAAVGTVLYAPLATVASAIQVAVAGGEKVYELGVQKWDEKCKGLE